MIQRKKRVRIWLVARSARTGGEAAEGLPSSRYGARLPAPAPDYGARAVDVLVRLMKHGSEPVRVAAAKAILQLGYGSV
ncbi:hypothetical protein [Asticcacaulis sp. AC402]|uniref:hypothetical protein n=1 Tax=Asticcacaulis sp. AC402 TaxID=1282361 RepID=UPI0003F73E16|nr:hypothetical protein [Asticcacaulis sp. AC402]